jgi:hypothetical protein
MSIVGCGSHSRYQQIATKQRDCLSSAANNSSRNTRRSVYQPNRLTQVG